MSEILKEKITQIIQQAVYFPQECNVVTVVENIMKAVKEETLPKPVQQRLINPDFPANPIAYSLMDLVSAKQLGMIRAIAREIGIDADEECHSVMACKTDELSKKAASCLIQHLQILQKDQKSEQKRGGW